MDKKEKKQIEQLKSEIDFLKSFLRSINDVKHGRVYPMKLRGSKV